MTTISAIYESGIFKPLEKVNFKEHMLVEVTPKASVVDEVAGTWDVEDGEEFINKIKSG